jgi:hypothetical protein
MGKTAQEVAEHFSGGFSPGLLAGETACPTSHSALTFDRL